MAGHASKHSIPPAVRHEIARLLVGESPNGISPITQDLPWRSILLAMTQAYTVAPETIRQVFDTAMQHLAVTPAEMRDYEIEISAESTTRLSTRLPDWLRPQSAADLDREVFPEMRAIVNDLIMEGLVLIVSPPKLGKSQLLLHIALAIGNGGRALGQIKVEQGDVLYFSLEDGPRRIQKRMRKLTGDSTIPARLHIQYKAPSLEDGLIEGIKAWLQEYPETRMVVIDILARVRPHIQATDTLYTQDYEALAPLQELAKEYNIALVVVHHTRKMTSDDVLEMASGSNGLTGAADAVLVLQRGRGSSEAVIHVISKDLDQDLSHAFSYDAALGTYALLGDAGEVLRTKERNEIIHALKTASGPLWPREIADLVGKKGEACRQLLANMRVKGEVVSDHGKYSLPATIPRPVFGNKDHSDHGDHDGDDGSEPF